MSVSPCIINYLILPTVTTYTMIEYCHANMGVNIGKAPSLISDIKMLSINCSYNCYYHHSVHYVWVEEQ